VRSLSTIRPTTKRVNTHNDTIDQLPAAAPGPPGPGRREGRIADRPDSFTVSWPIEEALGVAPLTANDEYATPFDDAFTWRAR
jgi:hypothetical protein